MALALRLCLVALASCCLLLCAHGARHLAAYKAVTQRDGREFDYFMFVRQWPGSYCSRHACPLLHDRGFHFTIHGLWPNYNDGSYPQFCDNSDKFDEDELEDIEDDLEEEWPSFMGSDETFWDHEWSKHGTCSLGVLPSEHKYFKTILKLHWRYDLAAALRAADILPSRDKVYKTQALVDAIKDKYGVRPLVHCYGKELSEIWMCVGRDLRPFDCDLTHESNTCTELTIPPPRPDASASDASASASAPLRGRANARNMLGVAADASAEVLPEQGNGLAAGGATEAAGGDATAYGADAVTPADAGVSSAAAAAAAAGVTASTLSSLLSTLAMARAEVAATEAAVTAASIAAAAERGVILAAQDDGDSYADVSNIDAGAPAVTAANAADDFGDLYDTSDAAEDSVFSLAMSVQTHMLRGAAAAAAAAAADTVATDGYADDAYADTYSSYDVEDSDVQYGYNSAADVVTVADAAAADAAISREVQQLLAIRQAHAQALGQRLESWREARVQRAMDVATGLAVRAAAALAVLRGGVGISRAEEEAAEARAEAEAAAAAAGLLGSRGFMWTSQLRASDPAPLDVESDRGTVTELSYGDGGAAWSLRGVVVLRSGTDGADAAAGADGSPAAAAPFSWLLVAQMACVAAIAVSLTLMLGMALAAAFGGRRLCRAAHRWGLRCRGGGAIGGLAEPLLEGPCGKVCAGAACCGASGKGCWGAGGEGVVVAADVAAAAVGKAALP